MIENLEEAEKYEFPEGKENYCPQCYFDDEKVVLRKDCKGHKV